MEHLIEIGLVILAAITLWAVTTGNNLYIG